MGTSTWCWSKYEFVNEYWKRSANGQKPYFTKKFPWGSWYGLSEVGWCSIHTSQARCGGLGAASTGGPPIQGFYFRLSEGKMSSIFGPCYYARGFYIGIVAPGFYFLDYFLFFIFSVYFEVYPSSFLLSVFFPLNFKCPFVCHILFGKSYQVILSSKQFKHKLPKNFSKTAFYYGL